MCQPHSETPQSDPKTLPVIALAARIASTQIDNARKELQAGLAQAAAFHARLLNLALPPVGHKDGTPAFARYQDALNFGYALFQRCRPDIEASGVAVGIEAAAGACFLSPVELREFIDAIKCWAVGVCVDADRVARVGSTADWLQTLGLRVRAIRLHDSAPQESTPLSWINDERPVIMAGNRPAKELRDHLTKLGW